MPRIASPKNDTAKPADYLSVITGAFSSNDLLAISARPQFAPQKITFTNTTSAGVTVVFTQEAGGNTTVTVPPNGVPLDVLVPVKALVSGGAAVEAHIYWWAGSTIDINK